MDDLTDKITKMLSDPETMEQIKGLAGMLGQNDAAQEPSGALPAAASNGQDGSAESSKGGGFDLSALSGLLSNTADGKRAAGLTSQRCPAFYQASPEEKRAVDCRGRAIFFPDFPATRYNRLCGFSPCSAR